MIDAYIAELSGALRGPRGARTELLTEARDSLVDAAERYQEEGFDRVEAERLAVDEFGQVREIAPEYQTELGLTQARRTALLLFVVVGSQSLASELLWRGAATGWTWRPPEAYMLLARAVDYTSYAVLVGSLLAALACGYGSRFVALGRGFVRATGLTAITVTALFAVGGTLLTVYSPMQWGLPDSPLGLASSLSSLILPAWVVYSARRCLVAI